MADNHAEGVKLERGTYLSDSELDVSIASYETPDIKGIMEVDIKVVYGPNQGKRFENGTSRMARGGKRIERTVGRDETKTARLIVMDIKYFIYCHD